MQKPSLNPTASFALFLTFMSTGLISHGQTTYNFTRINNDFISPTSFVAPSLNDAGRVAFKAAAPGRGDGIFSGTGQEQDVSGYLTIATNNGTFRPGNPGSYVGSRVAFAAGLSPNGGYFSSDGVSLATVVKDPSITTGDSRFPWMNRAGQIAFAASVGGVLGVHVGQNGALGSAYTIPQPHTQGSTVEMWNVVDPLHKIQINDAGAVFFEGFFQNLAAIPSDQISFDGLLAGRLSGAMPGVIVNTLADASGHRLAVEDYAANNAGLVACVVRVEDGSSPAPFRILKASSSSGVTLVDTSSGPAIAIFQISTVAMNDLGQVVFLASFKDTLGQNQSGLFTGPDLVNDKIIASGDPLFDSVAARFDFQRGGLNNAGQVAFSVGLKNGKTVIVRADPVAGGTPVEWVSGSGGFFDAVSNWRPTNGDPPRVPKKTATISDNAVFDLPLKYAVLGGTNTTERLLVINGDVTLMDMDYTAAALDPVIPSVFVDGGFLTLTNGILHSAHGLIGFSSAQSQVNVNTAQWTSQGRIEVGRDSYGLLAVSVGGLVDSAESRIANGVGGGQAIIRGAGSVWVTGNLAVGYAGHGEMDIESGGRVKSDAAVVGLGTGFSGAVLVTGVGNSGTSSEWDVAANSTIGSGGAGSVQIIDGGTNHVTGSVNIGGTSTGTGTLRVSGVSSAGVRSSLTVSDNIFVLQGGLIIADGAAVEAAAIISESSSSGTVTVSGVNAATGKRSTLELRGDPLFSSLTMGGSRGGGALAIDQGGLVHCAASAYVGASPHSCKVDILGLGGAPTSTLQVDRDLELGKVGPSTITLNKGSLEVGGPLTVFANGVIQGNGTLRAGQRLNNGGTISPGLSPGRLVLDGNYEQTADGRLQIEVGGPAPGVSHDQFVVNGNATLDGTLELRFINGFAPKQGDAFNFLLVSSNLNNSFATVAVKNLAAEFQFNVSTNGTNVSLVALNDGVFVPPLQGQLGFSNVATVGGISYLSYTLNVTNPCAIVEPKGSFTRQGQDLYLTLTERNDPNCQGQSANATKLLPLGAMPPGNYVFHFMADGVEVLSQPFAVSAGTGQVLDFTRTAGQELHLQINGVPGARYTIQQSADLQTWFDLSTHVGPFLGPYDIYEPMSGAPAKFYRVKIE